MSAPDPWKHRHHSMLCATCMWYARKERHSPSTAPEIGRCRRHAPTMNGYPAVFATDWCGDHKIDENKTTQHEKPGHSCDLCGVTIISPTAFISNRLELVCHECNRKYSGTHQNENDTP